MRLVIQRVLDASVTVGGNLISTIGQGLFVLVGIETGDTDEDVLWLASKAVGLRVFVPKGASYSGRSDIHW